MIRQWLIRIIVSDGQGCSRGCVWIEPLAESIDGAGIEGIGRVLGAQTDDGETQLPKGAWSCHDVWVWRWERSIAQLMRDSRRRSKSRTIKLGGVEDIWRQGQAGIVRGLKRDSRTSSMVLVSGTWSLRGQSIDDAFDNGTRNGYAGDKPTKTRGR